MSTASSDLSNSPPKGAHWGRYCVWRPTTTCHSEERSDEESASCCHVEVALLGAKETPQRGVSTEDAPVEQHCFHGNDRGGWAPM